MTHDYKHMYRCPRAAVMNRSPFFVLFVGGLIVFLVAWDFIARIGVAL